MLDRLQTSYFRKTAMALAAFGWLASASAPSLAQQPSGLVDATNINAIFEVAKKYGTAEMQTTKSGDPQIVGRINDTRYILFFEGCKENQNCKNVQFYAGWNLSPQNKVAQDRINEWNRTKRWGKAYIDKEGDPVIELDVNLFGGVSRTNFDDTYDWWKLILTEFKGYIGQ
jgi:hypothetical protein